MTRHLLFHKKTKILGTIGPASEEKETLKKLVMSGLSAVRINFSHGTHDEHRKHIVTIREVENELQTFIPILQDLQGPKIRLGTLQGKQSLHVGQIVTLSYDTTTTTTIPVQSNIFPFLKVGHRVFINDGIVQLLIRDLTEKTAVCEVLTPGDISSHKGLNLPDTKLPGMALTDKDKIDLAFGLEHEVDFVALSFIQDVEDITQLRTIINAHHHHPKIVAKIETASAIKNLEAITKAADVIMCARGDLATEVGQEEVPLLQRRMIELARKHGKPVIIATQMLESMNYAAEPTRAEVNDVATAVLDHADCVMLSAETATGKFPLEAVTIMNKVIQRVELGHEEDHHKNLNSITVETTKNKTLAISSAATMLSKKLQAKSIVAVTKTGKTALTIASFRPWSVIVVICDSIVTARQLSLVWGVTSLQVTTFVDTHMKIYQDVLDSVKKEYTLLNDDILILVSGIHFGEEGHTNTIHVVRAETIL